MKITVLYGATPNYELGLDKALDTVTNVLKELGMEVNRIDLSFSELPFFSGASVPAAHQIIESVRRSDGIIVAFTAVSYAPSAIIQSFWEYMSLPEYAEGNVFENKNCLILSVSGDGGEFDAIDYVSRLLRMYGAFDSVKIGLRESGINEMAQNKELAEIIEKQAEDYYRLVRQNRRFIISRSAPRFSPDLNVPKPSVPASEIYKKLKLEEFDEQQEQDIQEIAQFFAKKYANPETPDEEIFGDSFAKQRAPVIPREKTVRQMTQSLVHHYKPQLSQGLAAVIQIQINGAESFDAYLDIRNTECEYYDGNHENPDITILSDASVWTDVVKNKITAQKAFMIGKLKVRGNFMLLTRFDQLFDSGA